MSSLLYFVTVCSLKSSITEAGLAENSYTDGSLLQELERGYRRRFPIALSYNVSKIFVSMKPPYNFSDYQ